MDKTEIRLQNKKRRAEMSEVEAVIKSTAAAGWFLQSELYKNAKTIMIYMPLGNEVATGDIMKKAFADGKRVVLPVTDAENSITPCFVEENTQFRSGRFLVKEPTSAALAEPAEIDVVIVPGIAFDKSGNRIGFGKGCYDKFLKMTNAARVGICYDFQICGEIAADSHDEKMDYVVTEKGFALGV